ncbi:uncharacterized protein LOC135373316 [Ornithodoros turicata]|uniref:uncharacterized protein LOC135373316 n=1 Tax=Ornithodoros turicata TaxID=34597 RepID=UPI00313872F2
MDRLKTNRSVRRTKNTKLVNEVCSLLQQPDVTVNALHSLRDRLIASNGELKQLNVQIDPLVADEDLEAEYSTVGDYEDEFVKALSDIKSKLADLQMSSSASAPVNSSATGPEKPRNTGVKLPKLQLVQFKGELSQWQPFWEQFEATVHNNDQLSDVEKLQYLRSLLVGPAACAISGLQRTAACYKDALDILTQRFGDKRRIEREHLHNLRHLPRVKSSEDVPALRKLYDRVQTNTRGLQSLGVSSTTYSSMMVDILLSVLPSDIVVEYHRKLSTMESSCRLDDDAPSAASRGSSDAASDASQASTEMVRLLNFLRVEIESRERAGVLDSKWDNTPAPKRKHGGNPPSALVLHSTGKVSSGCFFCGSKGHNADTCTGDLTLEEKKRKLGSSKRCFRCTKQGHMSKNCRYGGRCAKCGGRHCVSLCDPSWKPKLPQDAAQQMTTTNLFSASASQTFRAWAVTDINCAYVRGIIDGGSQRTFVREDLVDKLGLPVIGTTNIRLNTFATSCADHRSRSLRVVQLRLRSQYKTTEHILEAIAIPFICEDVVQTPIDDSFVRSLRQQGMEIADRLLFPSIAGVEGISLLIGADQMWKLLCGDVSRCESHPDLVAISTVLGWTFQGQPCTRSTITDAANVMVCVLRAGIQNDDHQTSLRQLWELDSIGITDDPKSNTLQNEEVHREFEKSIVKIDGHYGVSLPWKATPNTLDDNYAVAEKRLHRLVNRLTSDGCLTEYDEAIRGYLRQGHAEKAPDATGTHGRVYYMPHRAVIKPDSSSTRLRVVFDASSHASKSSSLNDHLEKGPKVNSDLVPVLLRFRMNAIALAADIEKAFLQIAINEADRDALRFLWFADVPTVNHPLPAVEEWRMTRVPFGTTSSPFLLGDTLQYHLRNAWDDQAHVAAILERSFYVDDLLAGASTVEEAKTIKDTAQALMAEAGMNLTKWSSNSTELQQYINGPSSTAAPSITEPEKHIKAGEVSKVLGIVWDHKNDCFRFSGEHLLEVLNFLRNTKRSVLQMSARVFDPLGFLAPYFIRVKILFQRLWEIGLDWDDPLPDGTLADWRSWSSELRNLPTITAPRYLMTGISRAENLQLHVFTYASPLAYGACAYLRAEDNDRQVSVNLVFAKSRVAPLKKLTLPRLELMGAVIGARMASFLRTSFLAEKLTVYFWTDSTITLCWIRGTANAWKPFVANRVSEVQSLSDPDAWNHCPGTQNPADALTRGQTLEKLRDSQLWWRGPSWLSEQEQHWPRREAYSTENLQSAEVEKRRQDVIVMTTVAAPPPLMTVSGFSSYTKLLRVTAWLLRFVNKCRKQQLASETFLTTAEINRAEILWIKQAQINCYANEIRHLEHEGQVQRGSSIADLQPYIDDDGCLRVKGRLHYANISEETKHPILLPKGSDVTTLIVNAAHLRTLHGGLQSTLSDIREKYWIPSARQVVKRTIFKCLICRRCRLEPASAPTAPLPKERVDQSHPFDVVGLDYAGPLLVKTTGQHEKSYILLFTCATTRAVHLELVTNLSTESFLLALRRFVARRGLPSTFYSDNALTFKRAAKDIQVMWNILRTSETQDFCSKHRITWRFIVERAPWWGDGGSGWLSLTFEELMTVLVDIEASINSRPLTYIHADASEPVALTPAHFLIGKRLTALPEVETTPAVSTHHSITRRWKYRQRLMNNFWQRWQKEYLLELRSAHLTQDRRSKSLKEGDLAILREDNVPRHMWRTVRIVASHPGRDGHVRAYTVKMPTGTITRRPAQLLYPLEASESHTPS